MLKTGKDLCAVCLECAVYVFEEIQYVLKELGLYK